MYTIVICIQKNIYAMAPMANTIPSTRETTGGYHLALHAVAAAHVLPWLLSPPCGHVRTWHVHSCPPVLALWI